MRPWLPRLNDISKNSILHVLSKMVGFTFLVAFIHEKCNKSNYFSFSLKMMYLTNFDEMQRRILKNQIHINNTLSKIASFYKSGISYNWIEGMFLFQPHDLAVWSKCCCCFFLSNSILYCMTFQTEHILSIKIHANFFFFG